MSVPTEEIQEQPEQIVLDPVAVEKAMVERELRKQQEVDPVEIASMMLTLYTPRFCAIVDKLSSRQLRRVTKSLVEFPLGKTYRHTDELEKEAFGIGKNLLDAKYVLVANTYNENREEILRKAAEAAANENIEVQFGSNVTEEGSNDEPEKTKA